MCIDLEKVVDEFVEDFSLDEKFVSGRNFNLFKNQGGHFWSNDWEEFKNDESILIPLDEVKTRYLKMLKSTIKDYEEDELTESNINDTLSGLWDEDENVLAISTLEERYNRLITQEG